MHGYFDVSILCNALLIFISGLYMKHPRWCNTQTYSEVHNHAKE